MYVTVFYLDKEFSRKENEIIEKKIREEKCTAAIYDCSYYIYFEKPSESLRRLRSKALRKIISLHECGSLSKVDPKEVQFMSDWEFIFMQKEIYEFTLRDTGDKIEILDFKEFEMTISTYLNSIANPIIDCNDCQMENFAENHINYRDDDERMKEMIDFFSDDTMNFEKKTRQSKSEQVDSSRLCVIS